MALFTTSSVNKVLPIMKLVIIKRKIERRLSISYKIIKQTKLNILYLLKYAAVCICGT